MNNLVAKRGREEFRHTSMTTLTSPQFIPEEIIFDILSHLPVRSLLRFKCVCKRWDDITLDFQFVCLHRRRSHFLFRKWTTTAAATDKFVRVCSNGSLIVEYYTSTTQGSNPPILRSYRIRNTEMNQILELPHSKHTILNMRIVIDPDNQVFKLLSVVHDAGNKVFGYEVLDFLQNNDNNAYSWRPFNTVPNLPKKSHGETTNQIKFDKVVHIAMGTAYCIWDVGSHIDIDLLDIVNDRYIGNTTCPKSFYSMDDAILWDGKLSFAKVTKAELHVLVLEDYKKHIKWAERKLIIKLTFLKDLDAVQQLEQHIKLCSAKNSHLLFWWKDKESICDYDINTGKVTTRVSGYKGPQISEVIKPCLFAFKGMQLSTRSTSNIC